MSTSTKSPASAAYVRQAMALFEGGGCFPPWKSAGSTVTALGVEVMWVQQCAAKGVTGEDLLLAAVRYVSEPMKLGQTTRQWPAPGALFGARREASDVAPAGCGSCTGEGLREMAYRATGPRGPDLRIVAVHCDCGLGTWWAQRRAKPLKGDEDARRPAPTMRDYIATLKRTDPELPVYQPRGATFSPAERVRMEGRRCPPVVHTTRPNGWSGVTLRTGQDVPRLAAALVGAGDQHAGARQLALAVDGEREQWTGEYGEVG